VGLMPAEGPGLVGGPRAGRRQSQGGSHSPRARKIFSITSSWVMAARILILSPQREHTSGSVSQTFLMSRAQFLFLTFTNPLSSPSMTPTAGGSFLPESFPTQPSFLRIVVEEAP